MTMQSLVDELAEELGRAVVVDDPEVRMICASRHYGDEDPQRIRTVLQREVGLSATQHILAQEPARWTGPGRLPANQNLGMHARWCVPIRHRAQILAFLLVIDTHDTLTSSEKHRIDTVGAKIGASLYAAHLEATDRRVQQEHAVEDLLSSDEIVRRTGIDNLKESEWLRCTGTILVTVFRIVSDGDGGPITAKDAMRTALNDLTEFNHQKFGITIDHARACLVESSALDSARVDTTKRAQRLVEAIERLMGPGSRCVAGIGGSTGGPEQAWCAYEQACVAAEAGAQSHTLAPVNLWEELGAWALITQLPQRASSPALLPAPVRRLLDVEEPKWMIETLSTFLDHAGSAPRTAAALHIHRTSLYYRLDRIQEVTGLDLDDGANRLLLHIGVRMIALTLATAPTTGR
nr:helix-turn-helix domain-containing protein [Rhodococcus sp. 06-418-1B]